MPSVLLALNFLSFPDKTMDTLTPQQRHYNMSRIKGSDTRPEKLVRSQLHRAGFRFRKNYRKLPGKPDIVLPKYHAVIFINGCFWHFHEHCPKAHLPKTNTEFWSKKLTGNRNRDRKEIEQLLKKDWRVGIVWECSITGKNRALKILDVSEEITWWLEEEFEVRFREF